MRSLDRAMAWSTGVILVVAVTFAVADGELAGFEYPGAELVWAVVFGAAGVVIVKGRPGHLVGRLLLGSALAASVGQLLGQVAVDGRGPVLLLSYSLLIISLGVFPDGEWINRPAKWLAYGMVSSFGAQIALWAIVPLVLDPTMEGDAPAWVSSGIAVAGILGVGFTAAVLIGQIQAARSDAVRRRQVGVVVLGGVVIFVLGLFARLLEDESLLGGIFNSVSGLIFPVTIVIAVTRYRLYEIDRVISRTVSYGIVIAVMVGVYLAVLLGLGALLDLGGDTEVALATLAAVAVSVPLLRRVRRWVDRRFFRSRYDSAKVVARVADDLRTTVDLDEVERRTEAVIEEVFAPEEIRVWLAEGTAS